MAVAVEAAAGQKMTEVAQAAQEQQMKVFQVVTPAMVVQHIRAAVVVELARLVALVTMFPMARVVMVLQHQLRVHQLLMVAAAVAVEKTLQLERVARAAAVMVQQIMTMEQQDKQIAAQAAAAVLVIK